MTVCIKRIGKMITLSKMTPHEMIAERNDAGQETRQTDFQTDRLLDRQTFRQNDCRQNDCW